MRNVYLPSNRSIAIIAIAGVILSLAFSNNPPNGRTGAPGDGVCSSCHTQSSPPQDGSINITGFPSDIEPNTLYNLTVTVSNPNGLGVEGGFQLVVLNSENNNAGSLSNPGPASTLTSFNSRVYHEHNPAQAFNGNNEAVWTVDWTSPAGPANDQITLYSIAIIGNGGGSSGDLQVQQQVSGTMQSGALFVDIETSDINCFGEDNGTATATASGGMPSYTYLWSNGAQGATISNLSPGTYSVTVTDGSGTTATASGTVEEPDELTVFVSASSDVTCNGDGDGSATIIVSGGVAPYTYSWSDGSTTEDLENASGGIYSVTVTDENGCTTETDVVISEPDAISIDVEVTPATCGAENGAAVALAEGGTGALSYQWSNGATTSVLQDIPAGVYGLTVTDENACTSDEVVTVPGSDNPQIDDAIITPAACGNQSGSIALVVSGGLGTLTYNWSNGATTSSITDLVPEVYSVTISDEANCMISATYEVPGSDAVFAEAIWAPVLCFGDSTDILVDVFSGLAPFAFQWSNGSTAAELSDVPAGTYGLTVSDANGCVFDSTYIIDQPDALLLATTATSETSAGAMDGTVEAMVMGGVDPYQYMWSNGDTTSVISGLAPGGYMVTVTDANGCTATSTAIVNAFGCTIASEVSGSDVSCAGGEDGSAEVVVSGANGPVEILWSNGDTNAIASGLSAGTYTVMVEDSTGCITNGSVMISEPQPLAVTSTITDESTSGAGDGSIVCEVQGGTVPYAFEWYQNGELISSEQNLSGIGAGEYVLVVTDNNGCQLSDTLMVGVTTSTSEVVSDIRLNVFPNPASDYLTIEISGTTGELRMTLMDLSGRTVHFEKLDSGTVNHKVGLDELGSGIYFLSLTGKQWAEVRKVVIDR